MQEVKTFTSTGWNLLQEVMKVIGSTEDKDISFTLTLDTIWKLYMETRPQDIDDFPHFNCLFGYPVEVSGEQHNTTTMVIKDKE